MPTFPKDEAFEWLPDDAATTSENSLDTIVSTQTSPTCVCRQECTCKQSPASSSTSDAYWSARERLEFQLRSMQETLGQLSDNNNDAITASETARAEIDATADEPPIANHASIVQYGNQGYKVENGSIHCVYEGRELELGQGSWLPFPACNHDANLSTQLANANLVAETYQRMYKRWFRMSWAVLAVLILWIFVSIQLMSDMG